MKKLLILLVATLVVAASVLFLSGAKPTDLLHNPATVLKSPSLNPDLATADASTGISAPAAAEPSQTEPASALGTDSSTAAGGLATSGVPSLDLVALSKNPGQWPKGVVLKSAVSFPVVMNGNTLGFAEVPQGTRVKLVAVLEQQLQLDYQGGRQTVSAESTDLAERLQKSNPPVRQAQLETPPAGQPQHRQREAAAPKPDPTPIYNASLPSDVGSSASANAKLQSSSRKAMSTVFGTLEN